jgi:hypothetical protein
MNIFSPNTELDLDQAVLGCDPHRSYGYCQSQLLGSYFLMNYAA